MNQNRISESSGVSRSNRTINRGSGGRFVSSTPLNVDKTKRADQQRKYRNKRKAVKNLIFNEYLNCFVHRGNAQESIMASRSKGPFSQIFEAIVKEEYRLGQNIRHAGLRIFYEERAHLQSANVSNLVEVLKVTAKSSEYKGCRLPRVSLASEMSKVRRWITVVQEENALLFPSADDAFRLCKAYLRNLAVNGNNTIARLLPLAENCILQQNPRSQCRLSNSSETLITAGSSTASVQANESTTNAAQASSTVASSAQVRDTQAACPELEVSSPRRSELSRNSEEDIRQRKRLIVCLEIAKNEQMYTMLHLALDNSSETQFGAYSGVYLKELHQQGENPCELVKVISKYAHWKRYGSPDRFQYDRLERRLKNTAAICDRVRLLTSTGETPLPLYKDMHWNFTN